MHQPAILARAIRIAMGAPEGGKACLCVIEGTVQLHQFDFRPHRQAEQCPASRLARDQAIDIGHEPPDCDCHQPGDRTSIRTQGQLEPQVFERFDEALVFRDLMAGNGTFVNEAGGAGHLLDSPV